MEEVKRIPISEITPDTANANAHTERGEYMLDRSYGKFGNRGAIVLDKNLKIPAGNHRHEKAGQNGIEEVVVIKGDPNKLYAIQYDDFDLDDPSNPAREFAVADNRTAEVGINLDPDVLKAYDEMGVELGDWFTDLELDDMGILSDEPEPAEDAGADVDRAAELQEQWQTELGQLWVLPSRDGKGEHRLLIGDCTVKENVERLMGEEKVDMMFADPPYGVNYEGGHFNPNREKLVNDHNTDIYNDFLPVILPYVDGPCYMWFADSKAYSVYNAVTRNNCQIHALIIWHKTNATYAAMNAQYKQRHEPCLYFKPKGKTLRWCGLSTENTLWEFPRDAINDLHPTQKPICLPEKAIGNHDAKIVLDPFCGSGTTIIACENLNRYCRAMELSPAYGAIILQRYTDTFGVSPYLDS